MFHAGVLASSFPLLTTMAEDAAAAAASLASGTGEPKMSKNALKKQVRDTCKRNANTGT